MTRSNLLERCTQKLGLGLLMLAVWLAASPAFAEKRVALVIGNSAYQYAPALRNPHNDAADMSIKLKNLGFELFGGEELDRGAMLKAITAFGRSAEDADVALIFYAGHGLQVNGQNYLVPIDANVEYEAELDISLVPFSVVMQQLTRGSRINIALLDACRDNPFAKELSRSMGTRAIGGLGRGLSRTPAVSGSFIAYATQPDNVAQDGAGRNSPFTSALLKFIERPGLSLPDLMIEVRKAVMTETNGKQVPWDSSSLTGRFSFKIEGTVTITPEAPSAALTSPPSSTDRRTIEQAVWHAIETSSEPAAFEKFLKDFPDGVFAAAARDRLKSLQARTAALPRTVEIDACDRLAASPTDSERPGGIEGIELSDIDAPRALAACRSAVARGDGTARFARALGRALLKSGNQAEAAQMFRTAAENHNAAAMNNLGAVYEFGTGVVGDATEAVHWYQAAAEAGDATAMLNLGLAYLDGRGVQASAQEGQRWIQESARKGSQSASILLLPPASRGAARTIDNGNVYAVINGPR